MVFSMASKLVVSGRLKMTFKLRVFGTLNKELRINSLVGLTSSREKQVHATQLAGAASKQSRIYKACFNCLDLGHIEYVY